MLSINQQMVLDRAISAISASVGNKNAPRLYGPDGRVLPSGGWNIQRLGAKNKGSLRNWKPARVVDEAREREKIVDRVSDLIANDPHAAGLQGNFAYTVIGAGLMPQPKLDREALQEIDKEEAHIIQARQRAAFRLWEPFADAGERMSFGQIQFLLEASLFEFGEYFILLPMLPDDGFRPFSIACQVINPLRVKTPVDLKSDRVRNGVELGEYGQPVAYWIKKAAPGDGMKYWADVKENFLRIPARAGHRRLVIHNFVTKSTEEVRGWPLLAPAVKLFRDFSDLLDAELVANVVTAAFSLWIESGAAGDDPRKIAELLASETVERINKDNEAENIRYQEIAPGQIMYGEYGQKPHTIAANRPGTTFEPFTKIIKKAIAQSVDLPYPVAFRDVEGVNFAGFRSAMLDAWRVFTVHRVLMGARTCQPIYTMIQEEAYLRGMVEYPVDFYQNMHALCRCDWVGAPKGDVEPVKAVQADLLAINGRLKTRAKAISERGEEWRAVFEQLEEEERDLEARGIKTGGGDAQAVEPEEDDEGREDEQERDGDE